MTAGTKIANETTDALNKIVAEIKQSAEIVNIIAVYSKEQAAAIDQIKQGIMQISQVVQTNAVTVEENLEASEEFSKQAVKMQRSTDAFILKIIPWKAV